MAYEIDIEFAKREFFEENQSDDLDEMARAMAEWKAIELNLIAENQVVKKKERERLALMEAMPKSTAADDFRAQMQREKSAKLKERHESKKHELKKQKSKGRGEPSPGKHDQHHSPPPPPPHRHHHHHHHAEPQDTDEHHDDEEHPLARDELKKHKKSSKHLDPSDKHGHHHHHTEPQDTAQQHHEKILLSSPSKRLHPLDDTPPIDYFGLTPSLELLAKQQKSIRPLSSDFDKPKEALVPSKPMIVLSPSALKKQQEKRARKLAKRLALNRVPPKPADGFDALWFASCSCRGICKCFMGEQGKIDSMLEQIINPNRTVVKGWSGAINYSFNKFDSKWKDTDVNSNSVASVEDDLKGNSISSTVSGTGSTGSSHRKSRRFAKKPHTKGAFIFPSVDNGDREELLQKTLKYSNAPPVTTILRWRSRADNDELESFDNVVDTHQPFVLKKVHEVVTTFETEDPFQIELEQSSATYLEDLHITSERNKQATIRKKNFLRSDNDHKVIKIIEPKKLSDGKSHHSLPTKLLPIKFAVSSFFTGPDLNTERSDNDSILSRKLTQNNDTEPKKLEPLFEELPPPKPSKFDMNSLFSNS